MQSKLVSMKKVMLFKIILLLTNYNFPSLTSGCHLKCMPSNFFLIDLHSCTEFHIHLDLQSMKFILLKVSHQSSPCFPKTLCPDTLHALTPILQSLSTTLHQSHAGHADAFAQS